MDTNLQQSIIFSWNEMIKNGRELPYAVLQMTIYLFSYKDDFDLGNTQIESIVEALIDSEVNGLPAKDLTLEELNNIAS